MEINNDNGYQNVDDDLLSTEATDLNVVGGKQKIISCAKETFENGLYISFNTTILLSLM